MNDNRPQDRPSGSPDAASWFVRLQRRPHDQELRGAFETWLASDPANALAWEQAAADWDRLGDLKGEPEVLAAREALRAELAHARRRPQMRWAAGIAVAVLAGGAALGFAAWRPGTSPQAIVIAAPKDLAVYRTLVGGRQTVALQDGSKVTLSTDTEVRLTEWGRRRSLTVVKGEAFFEVARNPDKPFVVTAAGRRVSALGTAFDVRVDPHRWSVSLLEGKIRVTGADAEVEMTPGQQLSQTDGQPWTIQAQNVADLTSWREGRLVFENRPLGAIVEEMNRYSQRKMHIADARLASTPLSGRFRTGDTEGFVATLEAYGVATATRGSPSVIELRPPAGG